MTEPYSQKYWEKYPAEDEMERTASQNRESRAEEIALSSRTLDTGIARVQCFS